MAKNWGENEDNPLFKFCLVFLKNHQILPFFFKNLVVHKRKKFSLCIIKKNPLPKKLGISEIIFFQLYKGHYCILPVFFVPVSFVKECTDLLMSKSKSLLIVFVAYHHNANVNPRGYNEFISRFCVLAVCM